MVATPHTRGAMAPSTDSAIMRPDVRYCQAAQLLTGSWQATARPADGAGSEKRGLGLSRIIVVICVSVDGITREVLVQPCVQ